MEIDTTKAPLSKLNLSSYFTNQTMSFAYGFITSLLISLLLILLTHPYSHYYHSSTLHFNHTFQLSKNTSSASIVDSIPHESSHPNTTTDAMFTHELYKEYESMLNCDLFDGKWVQDDSYPLYNHSSCPNLINQNSECFLNGRPDSGYETYRWQPTHCTIPRFNGRHFLELIRGKRLVFLGDSLNRNMRDSLMCLLINSVEDRTRVAQKYGKKFGRHIFLDYNCSVEFYWLPFLVTESETQKQDGSKHSTLRLDLVDVSIDMYKDAHILVFNSGNWYTDSKTSKGRNYYQEGSYVYRKLDEREAFRKGMISWGKWVDQNVNQTNTQVYFRGSSAAHYGGGKWNSGGRCEKETKPFENENYLQDYPVKMKILESVMKGMKTRIHFLNITRLTDYRKDAHPGAYRKLHLSEKESSQDCVHWCLPGVPDTWNQILYAQILINSYKKQKQKTSS